MSNDTELPKIDYPETTEPNLRVLPKAEPSKAERFAIGFRIGLMVGIMVYLFFRVAGMGWSDGVNS